MPFRLAVRSNPGLLRDKIAKQVRQKFIDVGLDLADELQRRSPVGATGELRRGWDVKQPRKASFSFEISMSVTNSAPDALQRIAGSPPGTRADLVQLSQWVASKNIARGRAAKRIALLIAQKIHRLGTDRWIDGGNQELGIDRQGKIIKGGLVDQYIQRLADELNKMKIN